jgi:hypothetical protein
LNSGRQKRGAIAALLFFHHRPAIMPFTSARSIGKRKLARKHSASNVEQRTAKAQILSEFLRLGVKNSHQTPLPMESNKIRVTQKLKCEFFDATAGRSPGQPSPVMGMKWKSGFQQRRRSANKAGKPAPINQKIAGSGTG